MNEHFPKEWLLDGFTFSAYDLLIIFLIKFNKLNLIVFKYVFKYLISLTH